MTKRDIVPRLRRANAGRDPRLLQLKYEKMSVDPFAFLRGSCHLFHEDWPSGGVLDTMPRGWVCGDLHLENFGCVLGEDGAPRFEVNDYDECRLAPLAVDLARFLTSLILAGRSAAGPKQGLKRRRRLSKDFLDAYAAALRKGKARPIDRRNASAPVRAELADAARFTLLKLLRERATPPDEGERHLVVGSGKALALRDFDRVLVDACWKRFRQHHPKAGDLERIDAARRISGTGSLGIGRFVLLVQTGLEDSPYWLLDLKRVCPVTAAAGKSVRQPRWPNEAERVAEVAGRLQAPLRFPPWPIAAAGGAWVIRPLQASEQRFELKVAVGKGRALAPVIKDMGRALAAAHLRGAGWRGADSVADLQAFAADHGWQEPILAYAADYARIVKADHRRFVAAYGQGMLDP